MNDNPPAIEEVAAVLIERYAVRESGRIKLEEGTESQWS